jgi:hypothetical protein
MADLPVNGELLKMSQQFGSDQALADHLKVPRTTLRDHINRQPGLRAYLQAQRGDATLEAGTEIKVIYRDYRNEEKHSLYPLGDVHAGAKTHNRAKWEKWLGYLEGRENASLLGTGDFLNVAIVGSKSDVYDEQMTVGEAKRVLRRQLQSLADAGRIDGLMPGNHEDRITRAIGDCPIEDVCDQLDVNYIEAAALFVYRVGNQEYEIYVRHGTGSGQALAGLAKSGGIIRADAYVTGHLHRQAVVAEDFFVRSPQGIVREKRYFVSSGSFLGYERYAAQRGYSPGRLGAPRIFLDGTKHDLHISI